jgi:hypothetical protein
MGDIIDLVDVKEIYRCNKVKLAVVIISLVGTPISLGFLLFGIIRMSCSKKKISFLTKTIILIFSSEVVLTFSKLIQLIKYFFDDLRGDKTIDRIFTARGVICQIQIVTGVYADYCSLLSTLLLSLRCYDVIKHKNGFFDKPKNAKISLIVIVSISLFLSILFLIIDILFYNASYRYDVRDRCSYWCWLEQGVSFGCFTLYFIILITNVVFACKTITYLRRGYNKLLEDNGLYRSKSSLETPLTDMSKDNNENENANIIDKSYNNLTSEEKKRIDEIKLMKLKCIIYPLVTIILWICAIIYRIIEASILWQFDHGDQKDGHRKDEQEYFIKYPARQILVQVLLVFHTSITSLRGIFYGFSFIIFEEQKFSNFFRRCFVGGLKNKRENENESEKNSICASGSDTNENKEEKEESKERESKSEDISNVELDTSDYHVG